MAFFLVFAGLTMIITGINNTHAALGAQLKTDLTGSRSFIGYAVAIFLVGALGYVPALRKFSTYFMVLILISLTLANKGFFNNFTKALATNPVSPQAANGPDIAAAAKPSTASPADAITANQLGAFGQSPDTQGQAKFNGWMNYFLTGGWLK